MAQCPQCGGGCEPDPESGFPFCFRCGQSHVPPQAPKCPGLEQARYRATQTPYRPREH